MNRIRVIPLSIFTWIKEDQRLVAEASDLKGYDTDRGLLIESEKTGIQNYFVHTGHVWCDEDGFVCWEFVPISEKCPVKHVRVYND